MSKNRLTDAATAPGGFEGSPKQPSKADSNDVGYPTDDKGLRLMFAREAIHFGRLPVRRADRMLDSSANGERCSVCRLAVTQDALGYELEFAQNGYPTVRHHLHIRCFAAWESECRNVRGIPDEGTPPGNGRDTGHGRGPAR